MASSNFSLLVDIAVFILIESELYHILTGRVEVEHIEMRAQEQLKHRQRRNKLEKKKYEGKQRGVEINSFTIEA